MVRERGLREGRMEREGKWEGEGGGESTKQAVDAEGPREDTGS